MLIQKVLMSAALCLLWPGIIGCSNPPATATKPVAQVSDPHSESVSVEVPSIQSGPARVLISAPEQIVRADDPVMVRFELENLSSNNIEVLRWGTPLEGTFSRPMFNVSFRGQPVEYIGRQVKRGKPGPSDFVGLAPGDSVSAELDLHQGYAVEMTGDYSIALNVPYLTLREGMNESLQAVAGLPPLTIRIEPR